MSKFSGFLLGLVLFCNLAAAQAGKITGKVVNETEEPLAGATVMVVETGMSTQTDEKGIFSVVANASQQLQVSYIGYETQLHTIGATQDIRIVMRVENDRKLETVVVTALGLKRQSRSLGYSTQEVKGNTLQTVKGIDVGTSLTGKVSGLMVKNSAEFLSEPELTLRGEKPLLVIDGIPYGNMTLRDVPADDIESINFLKGATASALYGERGGSGAIMITTKRGGGQKGLAVTLNSSTLFEAGYLAIPEMQSRYGRVVNTATNAYVRSADGSWGPPLDGREVTQWDPVSKTMKPMPFLPTGKDNFKNFQQQGYILNNNLSIVQTGDLGSLRASASWMENKGTYPNARFDKITYSVGGDIKINRFSLSTTLSYNNHASPNIGFNGYTGYDPMYSMLVWGSPDWDIRDYKDYWLVPNEVQNSSYTAGNNNPYFDRYERLHPYKKDIFNGQLTLNYEFTDWLKAMVRTGYDTYSNKQEVRVSKGSFQGGGSSKVLAGGTEIWGESQKGSYNIGIGRGFSTNTDAMLMAQKKWSDFSFDGFLGTSVFYKQDEGMEARTQSGLSIPAYYSLKASVGPASVASLISKKQVNSIYGKLGAGWRNLAFIEGTFRNDWASTLSKDTRSFFYPSVAGSFIPSELLPRNNWLSYWKLRGSWTAYRIPADIYDINNVYTIATNQWGSLSSAAFPTSIRPSNIFSEGSATTELGTDLSFLRNRIHLDVALYRKRGFDYIVKAPISPTTGYQYVYTNSGEERTRKGVEISLNATPVKTADFSWNLGLNWSKYATYFTKIDTQYSVNNRSWADVGKRADYYLINAYQTDHAGNMVFNNGVPTYQPISSIAGYADPDWIWGFNTSVNYKSLSFAVSLDGRVGGLAQSVTEMYMWRSGNHPLSLTEERYLDATKPGTKNYLGQGVKVISGSITYDANNNVVSDTREFAPNDVYTTYKSYLEGLHKGTAWGGAPSAADLYSTTFLKLREVSLTYRLPVAWTQKIHSKGVSVAAIGQNLVYWAKQFKYSDIDGGTENFTDPSMRYIGLNIKLDF
ncbi:SusC/RagA family TonB-linked outer membrane protein [Niabella hirudinis]|uniref:SusC/RagA family TonB-linked outer membrane protein n=1 Tax=Niabella hirudinis TaxID=1285929 RepID=UPI003EBF9C58